MDKVYYKTVTGSVGSHTVGTGVNRAQILKVSRQGMQYDERFFADIASQTAMEWVFLIGFSRRIYFLNPFADGGETIHIIYKVTT